ncbi:hypothetical protein [Clavibacter michiganensis]|uniref:hypothetical protein n=1 Tax=Clavibacter michiganensis TaxID=28447 RepID=UPI00292D4EEA|nr:hypothetical protein [Clavibacter michiganensis]
MVNVEGQAVNEVSGIFNRCPLLKAIITQNDKTPILDGEVFMYDSEKQRNENLTGRVPVQVKGRTASKKIKRSADTVVHSIDRSELDYLRKDGGGLYFYVPISKEGDAKGVFYAILSPFSIDRHVGKMQPGQKSKSVTMKRFPTDVTKVQDVVRLALITRNQSGSSVNMNDVMPLLDSITISTLTGISEDRPTVLNLDETDFAVTLTTRSGSVLYVDMDLTIYPADYVETVSKVPISCGGIEYAAPTIKRTTPEDFVINLSHSLTIKAHETETGLNTTVEMTAPESVLSYLKDLNFLLAAVNGSPLVVGDRQMAGTLSKFTDRDAFIATQERIQLIADLIDSFELGDNLAGSIVLDDLNQRNALMAHDTFIRGNEIRLPESGYGRMNIPFGDYQLVAMVSKGADGDHRQVFDPLDPQNRSRFRMYGKTADGAIQDLAAAPVYDSLTVEDLEITLNLHTEHIVSTYEALENRSDAITSANYLVLHMLTASDKTTEPMAEYLREAAEDLCQWLLGVGEGDLIYRINLWQTRQRLGVLTSDDLNAIRQARREVRVTATPDAHLREACLTILLKDHDELNSILEGFSPEDKSMLKSWPIWALSEDATGDSYDAESTLVIQEPGR